jgi:hypothetical protein
MKVQCWLCDGPHSFRQCKELVHIRGVCTQRPQVRKHFRNLLLQKNHGNELKVLLEAPELFDDPAADESSCDPATLDVTDATSNDHDDHVNSLQLINSDLFTTFHDGARSSNIASFPDTSPSTRQLLCEDTDDDNPHNDFFVLAIQDSSSPHVIPIHPHDFQTIIDDIADIDHKRVTSPPIYDSSYYEAFSVSPTADLLHPVPTSKIIQLPFIPLHSMILLSRRSRFDTLLLKLMEVLIDALLLIGILSTIFDLHIQARASHFSSTMRGNINIW